MFEWMGEEPFDSESFHPENVVFEDPKKGSEDFLG